RMRAMTAVTEQRRASTGPAGDGPSSPRPPARTAFDAVWMQARSQLRRRVADTVLLTLLVGLAGGAVLAAVAGASRTDSAVPRFRDFSRTIDAAVSYRAEPFSNDAEAETDAIRRLPEVAWAGRLSDLIVETSRPGDPGSVRRGLGELALDSRSVIGFGRPIVRWG